MNALPVILPSFHPFKAFNDRKSSNVRVSCTRRVLCTARPTSAASSTSGTSVKQGSTLPVSSKDSIENRFSGVQPSSTGRTEEIGNFLRRELDQIYTKGVITEQRYTEDFCFVDPILRIQGRAAFAQNLRLLTSVFDIEHVLHSINPGDGTEEIVTRWTFSAKVKAIPWQQKLIFTGRSYYAISGAGQLQSQRDVWDAVLDNDFLSVEGVQHIMKMALSPMQTPNLDTPKYQVLKKMSDYEVRKYCQYVTAEIPMPSGSGPASGSGFNDLAGYIFGSNKEQQKMEMTTPVLTTAGQTSKSGKMAFVMEERMGIDSLPMPTDSRMQLMTEGNKVVAALSFSGLPLDNEVIEAERRLRGALLVDGLLPEDGYTLARYNDPFTLPILRRNEVLINLKDFELE